MIAKLLLVLAIVGFVLADGGIITGMAKEELEKLKDSDAPCDLGLLKNLQVDELLCLLKGKRGRHGPRGDRYENPILILVAQLVHVERKDVREKKDVKVHRDVKETKER
jgi:hypothetical protein